MVLADIQYMALLLRTMNVREKALPIGLINDKTILKTDVKKGDTISYDMVKLDEDSIVLQLRRMQDKLF